MSRHLRFARMALWVLFPLEIWEPRPDGPISEHVHFYNLSCFTIRADCELHKEFQADHNMVRFADWQDGRSIYHEMKRSICSGFSREIIRLWVKIAGLRMSTIRMGLNKMSD